MDTKTLMTQMIDLQKSSFDNGYETIVTLQDQTEKNSQCLSGSGHVDPVGEQKHHE